MNVFRCSIAGKSGGRKEVQDESRRKYFDILINPKGGRECRNVTSLLGNTKLRALHQKGE